MIKKSCFFTVLTWPSEILKIHLRDEVLSPEVDLEVLARDTPTFSGSDLKRKSSCAIFDWTLSSSKSTFSRLVRICSIRRSEGERFGAMGRRKKQGASI